jgi:hypothetical protein
VSRYLLALVLTAGLTALVGAEGPRRPTAVEQKDLLKLNQKLLADLIDKGVALSGVQSPLERADSCQQIAVRLNDELKRTNDAARGAELARHLRGVIEDGVAGNLRQARKQIPAGSQEEKTLFEKRVEAKKLLVEVDSYLKLLGGEAALVCPELAASGERVEQAVQIRP